MERGGTCPDHAVWGPKPKNCRKMHSETRVSLEPGQSSSGERGQVSGETLVFNSYAMRTHSELATVSDTKVMAILDGVSIYSRLQKRHARWQIDSNGMQSLCGKPFQRGLPTAVSPTGRTVPRWQSSKRSFHDRLSSKSEDIIDETPSEVSTAERRAGPLPTDPARRQSAVFEPSRWQLPRWQNRVPAGTSGCCRTANCC